MTTPLLEARAISRRFGHVRALDGTDFAIHAGEICALIGDNGAGKSTLVKILSGADRPDEGQILVAGKPVAFNSPNDAQAHGIATVYQDLALAADLPPFENLFLGREIVLPGPLGRFGFVNRAAMRRQASEQFERLGVRLRSPRTPVSSLSGGERQSSRLRAPRCEGGWGVVFIGLIVALASGAFWGAVNGALVAAARIPPLIVTLGTFGMALGFAQILTNGTDIRAVPEILVDAIGPGAIAGVPVPFVIAAGVALVGAVILHLTRFGVHVFAVGSDKEAARRAGIQVGRKLVAIYVLSGTLAGLAAVMSTARFATTTIGGHAMDNLSTISAVVLGGTSLFGGIGSIAGTVVGVFIPIVLLNGFVILGIPPFWQTVATGAVLILAVWIDQLKRRARERS